MVAGGGGRIKPRFERRRYRQRLPRQRVARSAGNIRERSLRGGGRGGGSDGGDDDPDLQRLLFDFEDALSEFASAASTVTGTPTYRDAAENYNARERLAMAGARLNEHLRNAVNLARPEVERGMTTMGNVAEALPGQVTRAAEAARPYAERGLADLMDATEETAREAVQDAADLIGTLENLQPTLDNLLYVAPDAAQFATQLARDAAREAGTRLYTAGQTAAEGIRTAARGGAMAYQVARENMPRLPARRQGRQLSEAELENVRFQLEQGKTMEEIEEEIRAIDNYAAYDDEPETPSRSLGGALLDTGRAVAAGIGNIRLPRLRLRMPARQDPGPSDPGPPEQEEEQLETYEEWLERSAQQQLTDESDRQAREREEAGVGEFAGLPPQDAPRPESPARVADPPPAVTRTLAAAAATVRARQQEILRGPRMFRNRNTRNVNLAHRFDPPPLPPVIPARRTMDEVPMTEEQRARWTALSRVMRFDPNDIPPHFDAERIRDPETVRGTDRPGDRRFTIIEPLRHRHRETREEIYQYQHAR